ncbi:RpiR family transcriptional regulator [Tamaricihabitans halophyticus]|uniref:RpiR family transcriptional regulator n=1 Tax=Tamaricihabitans halophyticus TaxID=1262583 RepID=A0A4R2R6R7_9PSEU|nr:MurR/RpiR family transcriptional regulator [Tamaricihabitans halophyticus]TCP55035.1 RpiR family transcriptional regulator [Tamaricihabitans halophyticus]
MTGKAKGRKGDDADGVAQPTGIPATVADRTHEKLAELSPSELKVGRALLASYPVAGLETVAELAKRALVSAPTVLRFAARIGFESYPAMQEALIREVHAQMGSPLRQLADADRGTSQDRPIGEAEQHYQQVLANSFAALPHTEFTRATELLADPRLRIHLLGGRFSGVLADYLAAHLVLIRKAVRTVPAGELTRATTLLDLGARDVLVLFDYRRYDNATVEFARQAADQGARIVLFTDPWLSPAAHIAEIVLPSRVEAPSPFDSLVPAMAVLETLVAAVTSRLGQGAHDRLSAVEELYEPDA